MIYQALKTWFQTYRVLLKLLMINIRYGVSRIGENNVMRKHGYGYLEEIVVRRAANVLYRFKEGDDVANFAIALRMFTRSLVIHKRVKDLQHRVDDYKRNRLMRSDKLYKFSDGTLTKLLSSLKDITKNIDMEYLSKRRWSTLENKRAHFMIRTSTSC
ncbi:hypothetical protein Tco_0716688 [Tanacetum coccineum]